MELLDRRIKFDIGQLDLALCLNRTTTLYDDHTHTHFFASGMLKKVKKAAIAVAAATETLFLDVLIDKILTDLDDKINSFDYLVINEREELNPIFNKWIEKALYRFDDRTKDFTDKNSNGTNEAGKNGEKTEMRF